MLLTDCNIFVLVYIGGTKGKLHKYAVIDPTSLTRL